MNQSQTQLIGGLAAIVVSGAAAHGLHLNPDNVAEFMIAAQGLAQPIFHWIGGRLEARAAAASTATGAPPPNPPKSP